MVALSDLQLLAVKDELAGTIAVPAGAIQNNLKELRACFADPIGVIGIISACSARAPSPRRNWSKMLECIRRKLAPLPAVEGCQSISAWMIDRLVPVPAINTIVFTTDLESSAAFDICRTPAH